jgi:Zn-dependent peptidase ImmA (M78 family)/transcriptional regulator with XRE-family HTH domain
MLILAREARGLTQAELAKKIKMEQGTISKMENEILDIEPYLDGLSKVLEFPKEFFLENFTPYNITAHYYRKRNDDNKKYKQNEAIINLYKLHIQKLLHSVEVIDSDLPTWDLSKDNLSPETCAVALREYWGLPKGRVNNLVMLLESKGIIIVELDLQSDKVDALSIYTNNNQALIFVNRFMPPDRQRFSIAHELGHLVMHFAKAIIASRDVEAEAMLFAGAFLMPEKDIKNQLFKLDLAKLGEMKLYWRVSMSAIIRRAKELAMLTINQYTYLNRQMSVKGYRTREPAEFDIPKETPTIIKQIIDLHINQLNYSKEELAGMLKLFPSDFETMYFSKNLKLRINKD